MSYFCANAISINKKDFTCKVKGGDNNVTPRSNYWSRYFPIAELIREVSGGMIQFVSRTEKNIAIEQLAYKYNKLMKELTGIDSYNASDLPIDSKNKLQTYENIPNLADHWNKDVLNKIIEILKDPNMLWEIANLRDKFVQDVMNLKIDKKSKFRIYNKEHDAYVSRVSKKSLFMNYHISFAKEFTELKAIDALRSYDKDKYEIRPIIKESK